MGNHHVYSRYFLKMFRNYKIFLGIAQNPLFKFVIANGYGTQSPQFFSLKNLYQDLYNELGKHYEYSQELSNSYLCFYKPFFRD